MEKRDITGFWWTWVEGQDWPSWYYGESAARDAVKRIAMSKPGRKVRIGFLNTVEVVTLPDALVTEKA